MSCSIGATLGNGGWSTLLNSAKGPLMINGQPPIAPPDIPEDRLNLPPIPVIEPQMPDSSSQVTNSQTDQGQQTQHMPGQQSTGSTATSTATTPAPAPGNTFLNGPPPPPGAPQDAPPPPDGAAPQGPGAPPGPAAPPPEGAPAAPPPPPGEPLPPPLLPGQ